MDYIRKSLLDRTGMDLPTLAREIDWRQELEPEDVRQVLQKSPNEWIKVMALFSFAGNEEVKQRYKDKFQSFFEQYTIDKKDHYLLQDIQSMENIQVEWQNVYYKILHILEDRVIIGKPYFKEKMLKSWHTQTVDKRYKKSMQYVMDNFSQG